MQVTAIETVRLEEFPNGLWVQVHTDEGLVGLGETFYGPGAVEAHIHEAVAPYLIGQDPRHVERHARRMVRYVGFSGTSAETRGNSAVDVALWDIWGQATGQPVYQLLGGPSRERVRVYNTCAGTRYVRGRREQGTGNFGIGEAESPYEDLDGFLNRPAELAQSLLEMGIDGMKIWPFDFAAEASAGQAISRAELDKALWPFAQIREAVGDNMAIMCELHSLWHLPAAKRIAGALEEFELTWIEDPVKMDHLTSIGEVAAETATPIATGETLGGLGQYRALLELEAVGLVIMDLVWGGGFSTARKVAALADAWHTPFTTHDCTGPVGLTAGVHMALNAPNVFIQEVVRAFYLTWYPDLVTTLPPLKDGWITAPDGPGLGIALNPDVPKRKDATVRRSE